MSFIKLIALWLLIFCLLLIPYFVKASSITDDARFCGPPARDNSGKIIRSSSVLYQFKKIYPCPTLYRDNGETCGKVWIMDHVIPLACGGCDSVINIQWLTREQWKDKSLWERKIYGGNNISLGCP